MNWVSSHIRFALSANAYDRIERSHWHSLLFFSSFSLSLWVFFLLQSFVHLLTHSLPISLPLRVSIPISLNESETEHVCVCFSGFWRNFLWKCNRITLFLKHSFAQNDFHIFERERKKIFARRRKLRFHFTAKLLTCFLNTYEKL